MTNQLPTPYQQFIHKSRYARWLDDEQRREDWGETVDRYLSFMLEQVKDKCNVELPAAVRKEIEDSILSLRVMPSMRAMMTAGPALARDNVCDEGYHQSKLKHGGKRPRELSGKGHLRFFDLSELEKEKSRTCAS